jgi:excisionase family DNA binding protein
MTVKEAAKKLGWTELFLREAIDQGKVDFGISVRMPGSSRRTFKISEKGVEEWISTKYGKR